jgi:hypothetical protein
MRGLPREMGVATAAMMEGLVRTWWGGKGLGVE